MVDANPTPTPTQPVAPDIAVPSASDAIGTDTQIPTRAQGAIQAAAPAFAEEQSHLKAASDAASTPIANKTVPHARLLAMVSGLATGLSAFGTAIATHGQEGGAKEVAEIQGEQQRQKIEAQQAAMAQKNQQIQQQLTVADTNHKLAQNILLMWAIPNELAKSDLDVKQGTLSTIGQEQDIRTKALQDLTMTGDVAAYNSTLSRLGGTSGSVSPLTGGGTSAGTTPAAGAAPTSGVPPVALSSWKNSVDAAVGAYPNDPAIKQYQATISDSNSTPTQMATAARLAQGRMEALDTGVKSRTAQEAAAAGSTVGKLSTPEALSQPGAQAAIQAKIDDPKTDPADIPRLRSLIPQAALAQHAAIVQKQREDQIAQTVAQGDPDAAGKLLASRALTLDELKLRNATPQFIESAVKSAQKYDPTFKAPEAAAQGQIARSPANQQFFGNTDSLLVRGGTLDQLASAGAALGNGKIPIFNTLANLTKAALGSGPQAAYAAAILGVADDYSKVMTGGQGSDTSRTQALNIINRDLSPEGRAASVAQIRKQVESQRNGRVGTNPYLRDMYPDPSTMQETPGVAGASPANSSSASQDNGFFGQFGGVKH